MRATRWPQVSEPFGFLLHPSENNLQNLKLFGRMELQFSDQPQLFFIVRDIKKSSRL